MDVMGERPARDDPGLYRWKRWQVLSLLSKIGRL